jgi:hypothetical protein
MNVSEYILLSREERTSHIDLSSPCKLIKRTGSWTRYKSDFIGFLGLNNDIPLWRGCVFRCHLCKNDTQSEYVCINPYHIYLGTPQENLLDRPPEKASLGGLSHIGAKRSEEFCKKNRERLQIAVIAEEISTGKVSRFESCKEASERLGISRGTISMCLNGKRNSTKGYSFKKVN